MALVGRRANHFKPIVKGQIDTPPRVTSAVAHEVDELVASYRVQPWQERPCWIPGMPLVVQTYEYLLHQIFSLMRTETHANETRRKRSTQGRRKFFEHVLIYDCFAAPLGAHGLCPVLLSLFHGHLFGSRCPSHEKFGSQPREPIAKAAFIRRTYRSAL
jgi:hypothetical protein